MFRLIIHVRKQNVFERDLTTGLVEVITTRIQNVIEREVICPRNQLSAQRLLRRVKREREIHLRLRFTLGDGRCRFWTCDLTDEYVRLNADYTT